MNDERAKAEALKKSLNIVSPTTDLMKFAAAMKADLERREAATPARTTDEIYARAEMDDY